MMKLNEIVPFGRSYEEYKLMFNLTSQDHNKRILGCGDGPASFNAEMREKQHTVISIDPIYKFSKKEIKNRFDAVLDNIIEQINMTPNNWVWTYHRNSKNLRNNRIKVMEQFLLDYEIGKEENRYQEEKLPNLPYKNQEFDLALCSHLLFLYSDILSLDFHLESISKGSGKKCSFCRKDFSYEVTLV